MIMIRCDRCGEFDSLPRDITIGGGFDGKIRRYMFTEEPEMVDVDLCRECQAVFDELVNNFMAVSDGH